MGFLYRFRDRPGHDVRETLRPRSLRRSAVLFAAFLMTLSLSAVSQSPPGGPPAAGTQAAAGQLVTVQAGSSTSSVVLGGTVVAFKQVTLTAQLPGRIEVLAGTEGDSFNKGDILVAIDDDDLLAKRRSAVAQLNNAQASISNAQVQYNREVWSPQSRSISRSGGMGIPSMFDQMFTQPFAQSFAPGSYGGDRWVDRQADLYGYGTQLSQAHSQVLSAQSQIEEIDAALRDTRSFAPFDGVIIHKFVEVGDTVQPGQPLVEYADLTYLQVEVGVPVRLMTGLQKGMLVPVKLDVGATRIQARVAQIFPSADAMRHTVTVKFDLPVGVPGGPGMYAEVMVPDTSAETTAAVPIIPDSAVIWRGSLPAVYVSNEEGKPELRLVRLGDYVGEKQVAVLAGLQVGERVYATPPSSGMHGWRQQP